MHLCDGGGRLFNLVVFFVSGAGRSALDILQTKRRPDVQMWLHQLSGAIFLSLKQISHKFIIS